MSAVGIEIAALQKMISQKTSFVLDLLPISVHEALKHAASPSPKSMMHVSYSPLFPQNLKIPPISTKFPFSLNLGIFA